MSKIILDIFDRVSTEIPNLVEIEDYLSREVEDIIDGMQGTIPKEYHDELNQKVLEVSCIAERKGFELGVKYMAKLLLECFS